MGKVTNISEVKISELVPYERNAKRHDPEQVAKIAASIREFGFLTPVLIDEHRNIIAGHGRVMAAREIGMESVPCVTADVLQRCYATIKRKAHENGLAFFCAENRLRTMGDDMCCCGIAGLDGFRGNDYNLEHLINGMAPEPTPKMKERGTGNAFCGIWQDTIKTAAVRESGMPFADVMSSADLYRSFLPVVRPDATAKRSKTK